MSLKLLQKEVSDEVAQENFRRLESYLREDPLGKGEFKFLTATLQSQANPPAYPATVSVPHDLGFVPKDVIQTSVIGLGTLSWNYANFTKTHLSATISNSVTFRGFFGSYAEGRTL